MLDLRLQPWPDRHGAAPHRSLWVQQALAAEQGGAPVPLTGAQQVDVGIVGGGFTGLWTAIRLLEQAPSTRIAIVEADFCGSGASGRNSGGMGHWWPKLPTLVRLLGRDDALHMLHHSVDVLDNIRDFVAREQITCELRSSPSVWSETAPGKTGAWHAMFKAARELGVTPPHRILTADELRSYFGQGPYYAGIIEDGATRVQPALLARGLRRVAVRMGATVYEQSPVLRIRGDAQGLVVQTADGEVRAPRLVLAANAWMADLPEFRARINVVGSDIVITDPIPELLDRLGMRQRPGGVNSRMMLNYGGLTSDGRVYVGRGGGEIAFGNLVGTRFDSSPHFAREVEADFRHLYPELRKVPVAQAWSGPIDRSATGLPWFGTLEADARVHYAIGYSGHGVAAAALGGRIIAAQVLELQNQWTVLGDSFLRARSGHFPGEPLRSIAGRIIRGGVSRKETAERDGRAPGKTDAWLARYGMASLPDRPRSR